MAPEQLSELQFSKKSDSWMFGCLIFEVFARTIPFAQDEIPAAIYKIMSGTTLELPSDTPTPVAALARRCWAFTPAQRPSMSDIIAELALHGSDYLDADARSSTRTLGVSSDYAFKCGVCGKSYP